MVGYILTRIFIAFLRIIPFRLLYIISDILYFFLYKIIGYRRKVVHQNLCLCFPDKSEKEIKKIEREYYHHLMDITLEGLKGFSMSRKEGLKRYKVVNPELINAYFDKGQDIVVTPTHYNNWEWGALACGMQIKHRYIVIYMPLSNKYFDNFIKQHRAKFNTELVAAWDTSKLFSKGEGTPKAYVMVADQAPSNVKHAYWFDFLNRPTDWIHGPEKLARRFNMPVIYAQAIKIKRGYYELRLSEITDNPKSLPDGEITRLYAEKLENDIREEPAYWLWSHRRWKHKKEECQ